MRAPKGTILLLLVAGLLASSATWADEGPEAAPVEEIVAAWTAALEAGDLEAAVGLYSQAEQVVAIESHNRVRKGPEGIEAMYREAFAEVDFLAVEVEVGETVILEGTTVCHLRVRCATQTEDGRKWELTIQGTWVLTRQDDGWAILYEHFAPIHGTPRAQPLEPPDTPPEDG